MFFALSQSFIGVGTQLGYGMGPLMVVSLTGSASLAGLTVALFGISRFLVSYPVGKITDTYGRKPGIQLGLGLTLIGTLIVGISMLLHGIVGLIVGMLIFGMGFNAAQQLRVAATDMYPPRLRALALGFVAAGAMLGLLIAPGADVAVRDHRRALRPRADRAAVADGAVAAARRHGAGDVRASPIRGRSG